MFTIKACLESTVKHPTPRENHLGSGPIWLSHQSRPKAVYRFQEACLTKLDGRFVLSALC